MSLDRPCGNGRPDGSTCGAVPTRPYITGHRCQQCAPLWQPLPEQRRAAAHLVKETT